jgi:hypothetical protein
MMPFCAALSSALTADRTASSAVVASSEIDARAWVREVRVLLLIERLRSRRARDCRQRLRADLL